MWLETRICSEFFHNNKSYSLKEKKHFILLRILWPIQLQFNKESIECSNCKIYLFQERFILLLFLNSQRGLRDRGSLVVKEFWTQRKDCPCVFRTCKRILQDSGTLKRVAWGLDVGTRVWPNQYKSEFALSLPLNSFIYYCFIFIFRLFYLNHSLRVHF